MAVGTGIPFYSSSLSVTGWTSRISEPIKWHSEQGSVQTKEGTVLHNGQLRSKASGENFLPIKLLFKPIGYKLHYMSLHIA